MINLFFCFGLMQAWGTGQVSDIMVLEEDTVIIATTPLEQYFKKKGERTIAGKSLNMCHTALWRGYEAIWKLENDSLFLIGLQICSGFEEIEVDLSKEFNSNKVFADWFSSTVKTYEGELLQYVHMGFMSIYEGETYYKFRKGKLKRVKNKSFIMRNEQQLFPGEDFLTDTIRSIIYKSIEMNVRQNFGEDDIFTIEIYFNNKGEVSKVTGRNYGDKKDMYMGEIILAKANQLLYDLPVLMKVKHKRYYPPTIDVSFSGYCMRYPFDRDYGCKYE